MYLRKYACLLKVALEQARSSEILPGSAFEEKVELLILYYSPGPVEEFIIVWCMLIAHIHESLHLYYLKSAFYLRVL